MICYNFQRLSPGSNSWEKLKSLPSPRCHVAVVALNGALYVTGGTVSGSEAACSAASATEHGTMHKPGTSASDTACFKYEPGTDEWTTIGERRCSCDKLKYNGKYLLSYMFYLKETNNDSNCYIEKVYFSCAYRKKLNMFNVCSFLCWVSCLCCCLCVLFMLPTHTFLTLVLEK